MSRLKNWLNDNLGLVGLLGIIVPLFIYFDDGKSIEQLKVIPVVGGPIVKFLTNEVPVYLVAAVLLGLLAVIYLFFYFILKFSKFTIVEAKYGASRKYIDIANDLSKHIRDNRLNIELTNAIIGNDKDPVPHTTKICSVKYRVGRRGFTKTYTEGEFIKLPTVKDYIKWF